MSDRLLCGCDRNRHTHTYTVAIELLPQVMALPDADADRAAPLLAELFARLSEMCAADRDERLARDCVFTSAVDQLEATWNDESAPRP